jgi:NAD(P)-dependent dehydrogenase (short-subunit alcohol dehydrogenase family)
MRSEPDRNRSSFSEFRGADAVVTGAASGIGAEVARRLASLGTRVAMVDSNAGHLNAVSQSIKERGGGAVPVVIDVTRPDAFAGIMESPGLEGFAPRFCVNAAGIDLPRCKTGDYPIANWDRVMAVNLNGVFYAMRFAIPHMAAHRGGSIVNIASIMGHRGIAEQPAYTAAKHGVVGLTRAAALDHAKDGIRINCVSPGYIDTPLLGFMPPEHRQAATAKHPLGRFGTTSEVSDAILFLLSEQSTFVTGSCLSVDGGYLAQ